MTAQKIFGIFGNPIGHTLSPAMHNAAFFELDLPYQYCPFRVTHDKLKDAASALIALGIGGVNITIPHKETILPLLDECSEEAQRIGAVNTIEVSGHRLIGHNTDGRGFLQSLLEENINLSGLRVILLGVGGSARAVAVSLLSCDIGEMVLLARTKEKRDALQSDLFHLFPGKKIESFPFDKNDFDGTPSLLINTTSIGMQSCDPLPYPASSFHPGWILADLVYRPLKTPFLIAGEKAGLKIVPGAGMLLHQAVLSFEIFTKCKAPIDVMRGALSLSLSAR
ncbi:MAG: shikimate dehydrogenase [Nitrospirota bacterium]